MRRPPRRSVPSLWSALTANRGRPRSEHGGGADPPHRGATGRAARVGARDGGRHGDYANPPSGAAPPVARSLSTRVACPSPGARRRSPDEGLSGERLLTGRAAGAHRGGHRLARLLLRRRPRQPVAFPPVEGSPKAIADLGDWNYPSASALLLSASMVSAHPSTPLGRGRGVVVGMLGCFLIGLLWICTFYVFSDDLPAAGLQRPRPVEPRRRHRLHGGRVQLRDQVGVGPTR